MTEEVEKHYRNNNICRYCEKQNFSDKVSDHCHFTGKYRGPGHGKSNIDVRQKQSSFTPYVFHNFGNYFSHLFFKKSFDKKFD